MSFQAPESDSDAPAGGFRAPEDDAEPPKSLEGFLGNAVSNAGRLINPVNIAKSAADTVKTGLYDLPKAALESSADLLKGTAKAVTEGELPSAEDVAKTPILEKTREMVEPIAKDPLGYAYKNPLDAALLAATPVLPFLGEEGAVAARNVPRETIPEIPKTPEIPVAEAPKGLPVVPPGAKTGEPHALFAYNDKFGPGGAERSIYNIFGDPEHPAIKGAGGFGSSVPKEVLDKNGIPVVGREPRSVGKWEPLEGPQESPPGAQTPPPAGEKPPTPIPEPSAAESALKSAQDKASEVKNYISRGYQGFAKKPGALADVADWVQEKSQMMSAQQMGFTPLQNRQLGATPTEQLETMRAIGQYGLDSDIVSPTGGLRHMVQKNAELLKQAGQTIGDIRKAADAIRDPLKTPIDPLTAIRQQLDPIFARGARAGETGAYQRALEVVEDAKPTFEGMADAATKLNKAANEANRLNQPHGAFTDVANILSRVENDRIRELMPEKAAAYDQALKEFGINKKIEAALKRKVGGEVKRMGPGSLTSNMTQKMLDEVGYRVGAKAANKLSTAIKSRPGIASNLPSLFKEFANQVDETAGEVSGMYQGGRVPDDVRSYAMGRGC